MSDPIHMDAATEQGGKSPLFRGLHALCTISAGLGGLIIFGAAVVVSTSVVLRTVGQNGIRGDFELVELACAACAALFLPLCQITRGHVLVDLFTRWMSPRLQDRTDGLWMLVFAIVWGVLAWRLSIGLGEMLHYGDQTMLLGAPLWWVYVPAVIGTGLSALIALIMGFQSFRSSSRVPESP